MLQYPAGAGNILIKGGNMKRKGCLVLLLALVLVSTAFPLHSRADEKESLGGTDEGGTDEGGTVFHRHLVSMDLWAGYSYLNMSALNQLGRDYKNAYNYANSTLTEVHSGVNAQLDLNFEPVRGLKFGPRVGVLAAMPGGVKASDAYGDKADWNFFGLIVPVSLGVSYSVPPLSRFRFTFGLDLGEAFGFTTWSSDYHYHYGYSTYDDTSSMTATASTFYANFYGALRILFAEHFGMDFKLGYHTADMNDWTVATSTSSYDVGKKLYNGSVPMDVDFGGVDASLGLSFYF
jgi:hypothetical protein